MRFIILILLIEATITKGRAQENCVHLKIEVNDEEIQVDSTLSVFLIHEKDTIKGIVVNNRLCLIVDVPLKEVDLAIIGSHLTLFFPSLQLSFLKIQDEADWLIGSVTKPFNYTKHPFLKSVKEAYTVDYIQVESKHSDKIWMRFEKRRNGTYVAPNYTGR